MNDNLPNDPSNPTFAVIIAAAGKSSRFSNQMQVKKPFARLSGKPVWLHSVEKFLRREDVKQVFIVVSPDDIVWFRDYYAGEIDRYLLVVLKGGRERVDSIQNALRGVRAEIGYVAVHDAARPCVSEEAINAVFKKAQQHGAAILASPIVGTVKRVRDEQIIETVPRLELWEAQTPQVFRHDILVEAYAHRHQDDPTDDSELVEKIGCPVHVVPSERWNLKITTQDDLRIAEQIILYQNKGSVLEGPEK